MRRLNAKLIFGLLGTVVVLGVLVFGVHWLQQGSIARALLSRAERAEKEDRPDQIARYVSRYLELVPEDIDQRARLGTLLAGDRMPATVKVRTRAAMVLEQVLLRDPTRNDLRLTLARVYLQIDRLDLAEEQLKVVQAAAQDNGEVELVFGQLNEGKKNWPEAAAWYRKAVQHAPRQIEGYIFLADLLRRRFGKDQERIAEADQVADRLVEQNADDPKAQLARWNYRKQWAKAEDAVKTAAGNVEQALKLAPEDADALLAAADLAQLQKEPDAARQYLEAGRKLHPRDLRMHRELALLELRQERRDRAIDVLRAGAKTLKGPAKAELLWTLANVLIDGNAMSEARAVIVQMTKTNASAASLDYLNARIFMRQGNWAEATRLLERTRSLVTATPELATQVDLLLSECFNQLDDSAARVSALNRMVSRENGSVQARLALAAAVASLGRTDDALEQYRQLMTLPEAPKTGWLEIARLLVMRDVQRLGKDGADRSPPDGKDAAAALDKAAAENPDAIDVPLLRAELLMARSKPDEARTLLKEAIDKHKDRPEPWMALATLAALPEGGNDPAEAARLLEDAQKQVGDTLEMRLAQIRYWARRGGADAGPALDRLARGLEKFTAESDQVRLLSELADAQFRIGNAKAAGRLWARLAQLPTNKNNLRLHQLLFDLALQAGDEAGLQRTLADLKRIEGDSGTLWRFAAASRLIYRGRQGKPEELEEARLLLDAVAARRPGWPNVLVAQADLEEARNNLDQAIAKYRRAMALGDRSPRTVRQLVQLLYRQQRYEEADQEMRKLQKETAGAEDVQSLQRLAVDISLQNHDPERAVRLALKAVAADSTDYRDHLWQGQVLAASGLQSKQAEAELRRAVELGPKVPETWVALVQFLARSGHTKEAEAELEKALPKLPADQAPLALAPCYEALGKPDQAEEQYRRALAAKPEDVLLLRGIAAFYLRTGRLASAEPPLRKVIDGKVKASAGEVTWARHTLAIALANCGDRRRLTEALALVGLALDAKNRIQETAAKSADTPEEQRIRARVLATQPGREERLKAIAWLETLSRRQVATIEDQFLLAQLYEDMGGWPKAQPLYRLVAGPGSKDPTRLARYAQGLLRQRELKEAEQCIARLEQLEKAQKVEAGGFASIELKAVLLEAKGHGNEAAALLEDYAGRQEKPERIALLVNCLARQKRYPEAMRRCDQARPTCPPEMVAAVTLNVLRVSHPSDEQCAEVDRWLQAVIEKSPNSPILWFHRAGLADLRGRYDEAENFCRKVLELEERNVPALNNLAWLLAQKPGKAAEALMLIDRAIALAGPRAELLDTRASAQLALGHAEQAIADLEAANAEVPDPARYFRLAQAHQLAKNAKQASALLKKATSSGLRPEHLHPVEQAALRKLMDELK